tara:strand:- start:4085 stop:5104 length:1020 start_codon:yes stop_codon:yes gene_type:complete
MATIGSNFVDLIDLYKRQDRNLDIASIIELLSETNGILDDAMAIECNNGTTHRTTVRSGLPGVTWGKLYTGIANTKSETVQVEDTTGFVEALSTIDQRLLDISGNPGQMRLSEAKAFLESMNQEVASKIFYGNTITTPEEFVGFAPRFNDTTAANGDQIVNAGGSGADNTSIWMVTWSDEHCHLLYPQGTTAGITREDKGEQRVLDGSSNAYYVKEELFRWHVGLTVRDWRNVVRIANIDISDLAAGTTDIYALMRQAYWKINQHRVMGGKLCIYANADVCEALDAATTPTMSSVLTSGDTGTNIRLGRDEIDGKEVMTYRGTPIRQVDALVNTEAVVS